MSLLCAAVSLDLCNDLFYYIHASLAIQAGSSRARNSLLSHRRHFLRFERTKCFSSLPELINTTRTDRSALNVALDSHRGTEVRVAD